jgi:outer membrane receptor protein involved in Fe transport
MSHPVFTRPGLARLRPTAVASACALALTSVSFALHAADRSPAELEAENNRLQAEVKALKESVEQLQKAAGFKANEATPEPAIAPATPVAEQAGSPEKLDTVVIQVRRKQPLVQLKDVPKSVSVVEGTELEKLGTTDFRDIVTRIGNVGMSYTNPQAGSLFIRGLGWATGVGALDPSVGVTVDGVSYGINATAAGTNFFDIDTVDVTRGPQGTLGGKNASVGQITIKTRAPSFVPEAMASVTYGQLNTLSTRAVVGGPLVDNLLAWRGTFTRDQADGPYKNVNDPNFSYKNTDRTTLRAQFLLTPTKDFNAKLGLDFVPVGHEVSDNYVNFNRPTPEFYDTINPSTGLRYRVNQDNEPAGKLARRWFTQEANYSVGNYFADEINRLNQNTNNYGTKGASLNLNWNAGENLNLSSITAYKDFYFDSGGGPTTVFDINRSPSTGHVEYRQFSQELSLASRQEGFFKYKTGLYFFRNEIPERWTTTRFGSDAGAYYATKAQYDALDASASGQSLLGNSLNRLFTKTRDVIKNTSTAWYGNIDLKPTEALTVNTGLRLTYENRKTSSESGVVDQGYGAELNPVSRNNVQLGGFNSNADTGVLGTNSAAQLALADYTAQKYFGVASYSQLSTTQMQQVAYAKAIRLARLGTLYQPTDAAASRKLLPTVNLSPSYKFNAQHTGYVSWQHGEKAGVSQIVGATSAGGTSALVRPEKTDSYELGLKSSLMDNTLQVNTGLFLTNIKDYIQPLYYYDEAQTRANNNGVLAYTSGLGNVPKVQSKGLELDASYGGLRYTVLRFAGAYTDARYKEFNMLAKPLEMGGGTSAPYYDASGKTLPGAAKFTFNLNASYVRPVWSDKEFHATVNYHYTTKYNVDPSLSRYTWVGPYGITDLAIGLGRKDKLVDTTLIMKNVFNTDYGFLGTWNSYFPSPPRWVGVMVTSKL